MDALKNLAISEVATAPSPATSGTSLVVTAGHGTRFAAVPFNAYVSPANTTPDPTNTEVVRVTAISTDTLTIARAQEGSTARAIQVGDVIRAGPTKKYFDDLIAADLPLATGLADGTYSGITQTGVAGETLAHGDLVYLKTSDTRWWKTDADAAATSGGVRLAFAVSSASAAEAVTLLAYGNIRANSKFPTFTVGVAAYVSVTAGEVQVAQPSGTDDVIRIAGFGNTADELHFNPSSEWMEHV